MSYYEPQQIVKAGSNILFVRASNSLYSYNLNDHSVTTYDKVNALSDTYISYIAWSQQAKRLIIVYQNGNIDLMDLQENITNISSLYTKTLRLSTTSISISSMPTSACLLVLSRSIWNALRLARLIC